MYPGFVYTIRCPWELRVCLVLFLSYLELHRMAHDTMDAQVLSARMGKSPDDSVVDPLLSDYSSV
ncbi:hypothetical protein BD310DRAFT_932425 [Dichomitus squalens]|uniref:Uncharacterized protein n=1 Tax=Dichomitus squalens TaxID=114155 RepID=A0A4Q9PNZ6_9APHY|nr:hypothetical protein BD310DRAFT_932425 [Dichomitus squalens]